MNVRTYSAPENGGDEPLAVDHFLANGEFADDAIDDDVGSPGRRPVDHEDYLDAEALELHDFEAEEGVDGSIQLSEPKRRGRPKGSAAAAEPPPIPEGAVVSVYDRLTQYNLLRKITDIVMVKVGVPWHLRKDAAQEIHCAWVALTVKSKFQRNQLANYAYLSGQHAALKLRRTLGAVVVIPGALFRTGRNTSFMSAIGAAVNPRDVDDFKDSVELSVSTEESGHLNRVSDAFFCERMSGLSLTAKQRNVAYMTLVQRKPAEQVAQELDMPLMYVERLLNQVSNKLNLVDQGKVSRKAPKQPKEPKIPKGKRAKAQAEEASAVCPGDVDVIQASLPLETADAYTQLAA